MRRRAIVTLSIKAELIPLRVDADSVIRVGSSSPQERFSVEI